MSQHTATTRFAVAALALAAAVACDDPLVPDLNNPSVPESGIITNPTRAQIAPIVMGLLVASRADQAFRIRDFEILGRNAYNLDNADPRYTTEMLGASQFDPGGFGAAHWLRPYRAIRVANVILRSMETAGAPSFSAAEIAATRGFAQTFKALELLYVYESRDTLGIARDVGLGVDDLSPILCKAPALARIADLLDSARTNLLAGGSAFPFVVPSGFAGFDTPATFLRFNRAIKARAEIYRQGWAAALTAITESAFDTTKALDLGVYHTYSTAAGDTANAIVLGGATIRAHPSVTADAEPGDLRVARKVAVGSRVESGGIASNLVFTLYESASSPIPIIRNEEVILMRAEAKYFTNDLVGALADVNYIRRVSGGLAPRGPFVSQADFITELLKQRRYSLLMETGPRWIDARRYGRLGTIPLESVTGSTFRVHPVYPIPQDERLARRDNVACTSS